MLFITRSLIVSLNYRVITMTWKQFSDHCGKIWTQAKIDIFILFQLNFFIETGPRTAQKLVNCGQTQTVIEQYGINTIRYTANVW